MSRYRYDAATGKMLTLDPKTGKWKPERNKTKDKFNYAGRVNFMPDIKEFVANATDKPTLITSRSQLARYERSNNIRQCGDFKPGEIIAREKKRKERDMQEASRLASETRMRGKAEHFKWV